MRNTSCVVEMAKPKSLTTEKVSNHIPEDLAFSVLSKLPLKSLKRFGCVSKTWSLLFQIPNFLSKFRNNFISIPCSYYNDTSLLLHQVVYNYNHDNIPVFSLQSLFGERFENRLKLDFPNPFQQENPSFYILGSGSITGILCLYQFNKVVLWNPTTDEFKVIPPSSAESVATYWSAHVQLHGFGYDHVTDDYKIIRYVLFFERTDHEDPDVQWGELCYEPLWEIYSLRCNSWRKINVDIPTDWEVCSEEGLFMDGLCHWCSRCKNNGEDQHFLVSFDLINELSFTTLIPLDIDANEKCNLVQRDLIMLNGSIASISWYLHTSTFHISVLGELGVKESWTKLFVVGPLPYIAYPIGAGKNGHIFFRKKDGGIVWFDLSNQIVEELDGVKGANYSHVIIYKENLLSIGGINH